MILRSIDHVSSLIRCSARWNLIPGTSFKMFGEKLNKLKSYADAKVSNYFPSVRGAVLLILFSSLALLPGRNQGYLAAIFLFVSTQFFNIGTYQYADVPLAFFILSTVILFSLKDLLSASLRRIMIQLWPTWVFLFFYSVKGPEKNPEILGAAARPLKTGI